MSNRCGKLFTDGDPTYMDLTGTAQLYDYYWSNRYIWEMLYVVVNPLWFISKWFRGSMEGFWMSFSLKCVQKHLLLGDIACPLGFCGTWISPYKDYKYLDFALVSHLFWSPEPSNLWKTNKPRCRLNKEEAPFQLSIFFTCSFDFVSLLVEKWI